MAQYRLGGHAAAIAALLHPEDARLLSLDPLLSIQRLAFLAMAQHRAGRRDDAQKTFEQLRELMKPPFGPGRQRVADRWFREAKSVLRTRAI